MPSDAHKLIIREHELVGLERVETFTAGNGSIERLVRDRGGHVHRSIVTDQYEGSDGEIDAEVAERYWLRNTTTFSDEYTSGSPIKCVDLFSGCGGLSLGVREAARALGKPFIPSYALDIDSDAARVYAKNFPGGRVDVADITTVFDGVVGDEPTPTEQRLAAEVGAGTILVGGPPCQGHSDLNNRTRRLDPKNEFYFSMVRAAEVLLPEHVIIENVPGAANDRRRVVQRTAQALEELGYSVDYGVVNVSQLGVPQRRRRLVMVASTTINPCVESIETTHQRNTRTIEWAMQDLAGLDAQTTLDEPANSAPATRRRIDHLFENGLHDLPNSERPPCHRDREHTYSSVYGRLRWEDTAQTITTGFYSMCMGRYVHPSERRTITAHEAARLQYFPDWFDFSAVDKRTSLARMIGNAVPSRLAYAVLIELLR